MYIDLVIKIKNAQKARKDLLKTRHSKVDEAIIDVLARKGFVKSSEVKGKGYKKYVEIVLGGKREIQGVKILSKPSVKKYIGYQDIKPVKNGFGTLVISTPRGIMTGSDAKKAGVGGQLLFEVW